MQNCLKRLVIAYIITPDGEMYFGRNDIENTDIKECPREKINAKFGERYDLCRSECRQTGHAEVNAIKSAKGANLKGSTLFLWGIDRICDECKKQLKLHQINDIILDISDAQREILDCQFSGTVEL